MKQNNNEYTYLALVVMVAIVAMFAILQLTTGTKNIITPDQNTINAQTPQNLINPTDETNNNLVGQATSTCKRVFCLDTECSYAGGSNCASSGISCYEGDSWWEPYWTSCEGFKRMQSVPIQMI